MNAPTRYVAAPAVRSEEPLLLGIIGPPGGGKTLSSLRLAKGIQSVRGGDIVVIDTEGGRSRKYNDLIPFNIVELTSGRSNDFLDAIRAQLPDKPAAIVVDSMSDEHESYLEWHDEMVPKMGNNEWAAWAKPKAARKQLISGILKIKVPLIFTFRAREKTKQDVVNGKKSVVNIGWQPVAPLEIVHTLDLTCILPPRADGVPVWQSDKIGEDFIIKLPNYLAPYIDKGKPLCEDMGAAFARWAKGGASPESSSRGDAKTAPLSPPPPDAESGAVPIPAAEEYVARWNVIIDGATNGPQLAQTWNDQKAVRNKITWPDDDTFANLQTRVRKAIDFLNKPA
jgi:hypothetical protein